jgi:Domain of unknown function (DUF4037)
MRLFVDADAVQIVRTALDSQLPEQFSGWPVRFYKWQTGQVEHHVEVSTLEAWLDAHLGFDPRGGVPTERWLTTSQQVLLEATRGAVFRDDSGSLALVRDLLAWYPDDVWLWIMACQWCRILDREHLVGRTAEAGDKIGSRLIAAQLARDVMRLCFLQERQYAPYDKWLGSAFSKLRAAPNIGPALGRLVDAATYEPREEALVETLEAVARRHNALRVTDEVDPTAGPFAVLINDAVRPFRVLNAIRFVEACRQAITDTDLRKLEPLGSIDQLTNSSDLLIHFTDWPGRLAVLYRQDLDRASTPPDQQVDGVPG